MGRRSRRRDTDAAGSEQASPASHYEPIPADTDQVARQIVDGTVKVHMALGPGLLESVYELCLTYELRKRGLNVDRQVALPVVYDGLRLDAGLRLDLLVEERVIVEVKAVQALSAVHEAQVLTYLKLSGLRLAFLINFNMPRVRDGITRLAR